MLHCAQQGEYNLLEKRDWLEFSRVAEGSLIESYRGAAKTDCREIGAGFCQLDASGA